MAEIVSVESVEPVSFISAPLTWFKQNNKFTKLLIITIILLIIVGPTVISAVFFGNAQTTQTSLQTEFGIQISLKDSTLPTANQIAQISPSWIRFVILGNCTFPSNLPSSSKKLVVFNNQSCNNKAPLGSTDQAIWDAYITNYYLPSLSRFLAEKLPVNAIEIWNEEDICPNTTSYCPKIPPAIYASLVSQAALVIKDYNAKNNTAIKVVMGGLASGNPTYVQNVLAADKNSLENVDAIGIHPYGKTPDPNWWSGKSGTFSQTILSYQHVTSIPLWVTEIGYGTLDTNWQTQYLQKTFSYFQSQHIPVVIWYIWTDADAGGDGSLDWGLFDTSGNIKPSGKEFASFTNLSQGGTKLHVYISLQFINEKGGKSADGTVLKINNAPVHTSQELDVYLYKVGGTYNPENDPKSIHANPSETIPGALIYNAEQGVYTSDDPRASVIPPIPESISGKYLIAVKVPGYLKKDYGTITIPSNAAGAQNITLGSMTSPIQLIAGDVDGDGIIGLFDYNELIACFPGAKNSQICDPTLADLNDKPIPKDSLQAGNLWAEELSLLLQNIHGM